MTTHNNTLTTATDKTAEWLFVSRLCSSVLYAKSSSPIEISRNRKPVKNKKKCSCGRWSLCFLNLCISNAKKILGRYRHRLSIHLWSLSRSSLDLWRLNEIYYFVLSSLLSIDLCIQRCVWLLFRLFLGTRESDKDFYYKIHFDVTFECIEPHRIGLQMKKKQQQKNFLLPNCSVNNRLTIVKAVRCIWYSLATSIGHWWLFQPFYYFTLIWISL